MNLLQLARAQWDRFGAGALFALGALSLVLGWVGVSREALTALQIPYVVSGGLGGIFLLGLGAVLWLSADLRDEWRKLDAIEAAMSPAAVEVEAAADPTTEEPWHDAPDAGEPPAPPAAPIRASNGDARNRRQLRAST